MIHYTKTLSISTTLHVMNKMLEIRLQYICYNIIQKLKNYSSPETHRVASDFFLTLRLWSTCTDIKRVTNIQLYQLLVFLFQILILPLKKRCQSTWQETNELQCDVFTYKHVKTSYDEFYDELLPVPPQREYTIVLLLALCKIVSTNNFMVCYKKMLCLEWRKMIYSALYNFLPVYTLKNNRLSFIDIKSTI